MVKRGEIKEAGHTGWGGRSRPIAVAYGIRAMGRGGKIGETWWSQRWIGALEGLGIGGRLAGGRWYARRGQVVTLEVEAGRVRARVQGSRPAAYEVEIQVRRYTEEEWGAVISALSAQAIYAAKLLAGEMPHEVEEVLRAAGVELFPESANELKTTCSCPDWANPCKHIAAVYYLLADKFDRDPFLIFALRGKKKEEVLRALRGARLGGARETGRAEEAAGERMTEEQWLKEFWRPGKVVERFVIRPERPTEHMALLKRLGRGPFVEIKPTDVLSVAYDVMSKAALEESGR
ncbi:MAG: SWIM zinc finger family protein [bacterium]|nr:SWIM zinc finger family protein [bacterium]